MKSSNQFNSVSGNLSKNFLLHSFKSKKKRQEESQTISDRQKPINKKDYVSEWNFRTSSLKEKASVSYKSSTWKRIKPSNNIIMENVYLNGKHSIKQIFIIAKVIWRSFTKTLGNDGGHYKLFDNWCQVMCELSHQTPCITSPISFQQRKFLI